MKLPWAVGIALLLAIWGVVSDSSYSQEKVPPQRRLTVTPEVRLQLPQNFTVRETRIKGLTQIFVQLSRKQSAEILVTSEKRRSEEEATRRLLEVAQEAGGHRTFVEICGWPAFERQYRRRQARPEGHTQKPQPEAPIVQAATVVVAQGSTLIRFEAILQPGAKAEEAGAIFGPLRALSCPASPKPEETKKIIERLERQLSENPGRREEGELAGPETALGPPVSEIQIATSADSKTVVVGSNAGTSFSTDFGDSFAPSSTPVFSNGDPTLARGASGSFYLSGINITATTCDNPVAINSGNGGLFALKGTATSCPRFGPSMCTPDQPQMAADGMNSATTGDQLYVVRRHATPTGGIFGAKECFGSGGFSGTLTITCSSDSGATWGHDTAVGSGDWGRITVGPDGFVYVTFFSGSNVMINKFSSCSAGLVSQAGFPVTIAATPAIQCPSGLDRCGLSLAAPIPAVSPNDPTSIFVTYPEKTSNTNDDIVVRHSGDGGLTWPDRVVANSTVDARRFMPWVCGASNGANVSWYDRRFATMGDDTLTDYFLNSTMGTVVGTERRLTSSSDSQRTGTAPFRPKYGDYTGNACSSNRVYAGWASATAPPAITAPSGINVFVEPIPPGPPMITSVVPAQTQCGSGTTVTIAGANFRGVSQVQLEASHVTVLLIPTVNSNRSITVTIPNDIPGNVYELVVFTSSGSSRQPLASAHTDLFSVLPTVTGMNPTGGPVTGGTQVTVSGSCFDPGTQVLFGGIGAHVDQCSTATQCVVHSPAATVVGPVDVLAKTGGAISTPTPADIFAYGGPHISSLTPARGPVTGGTTVEIRGSGFPTYDGFVFHLHPLMQLTFGTQRALAQCYPTHCTAITPFAFTPGSVDVVMDAFGASSDTNPGDVFTYTTKPELTRFDAIVTDFEKTFTVGLDGNAPAGNASVALSSDNPTLVAPTSPVTILAGQTTVSAPITVSPSPTNQAVTLTASYDGKSLLNTVNVAPTPPLRVSIKATALGFGQSTQVFVGLNAPAPPGDALITMTSSNPLAISVPSPVRIAAGNTSATFTITSQFPLGFSSVTISAAYNGANASSSVIVFAFPQRLPCRHGRRC